MAYISYSYIFSTKLLMQTWPHAHWNLKPLSSGIRCASVDAGFADQSKWNTTCVWTYVSAHEQYIHGRFFHGSPFADRCPPALHPFKYSSASVGARWRHHRILQTAVYRRDCGSYIANTTVVRGRELNPLKYFEPLYWHNHFRALVMFY